MKKIVTILFLAVLSLSAFAQNPKTPEDIDAWAQNEIRLARESFRKDSIEFMRSRTEKLNLRIKKISDEAEKQKKKLEKKNSPTKKPATEQDSEVAKDSNIALSPDTIASHDTLAVRPLEGPRVDSSISSTPANHAQQEVSVVKSSSKNPSNNGAVTSLKKGCKDYLNKLTQEDETTSTRQFILSFLSMSDDIGQYYQIKEDLVEIYGLLTQRGQDITELKLFIEDLQIVSFADSVLSSPYNKAKRVEAQNKMKRIKFMTEKQRKCTFVNSLRHGLDIYFLCTSNMMDFITEIKECHTKYIASKTDEEKTKISKDLTESIEFDARVKNFRSVKFMSDMYDKIVSKILCYDDNNRFVFQEFKMDDLEKLKSDLESMRQ